MEAGELEWGQARQAAGGHDGDNGDDDDMMDLMVMEMRMPC